MPLGGYAGGNYLTPTPGYSDPVPTRAVALALYARGDRRYAELQGVTLGEAQQGFADAEWFRSHHVGCDGSVHGGHYVFVPLGERVIACPAGGAVHLLVARATANPTLGGRV
jgi:hypothetical protein